MSSSAHWSKSTTRLHYSLTTFPPNQQPKNRTNTIHSRTQGELNEPSAIFELATSPGHKSILGDRDAESAHRTTLGSGSGSAGAVANGNSLRFEADRRQLGQLLAKFDEIQAALDRDKELEDAAAAASPDSKGLSSAAAATPADT